MKRDRVSFDYDLRFVVIDKIQIECWYWLVCGPERVPGRGYLQRLHKGRDLVA
jgi:hypothetical protein